MERAFPKNGHNTFSKIWSTKKKKKLRGIIDNFHNVGVFCLFFWLKVFKKDSKIHKYSLVISNHALFLSKKLFNFIYCQFVDPRES